MRNREERKLERAGRLANRRTGGGGRCVALNFRMAIEELLSTYPRIRTPLPAQYEAHYLREYRINRTGASLATALAVRMESWMHRQVALRSTGGSLLELGAGTLNHLAYEREYVRYDIVEPFVGLVQGSPALTRISNQYRDISEVPSDWRYDRVISIAVLEHLTDLPAVVARAALLLAEGGIFQAGIPSEGGFLWGLAWRCTTALGFRLRTGLDYGVLMRHEHVNKAAEILAVVRHYFEQVSIRFFPAPGLHLSVYIYLEASGPRRSVCAEFLSKRNPAAMRAALRT